MGHLLDSGWKRSLTNALFWPITIFTDNGYYSDDITIHNVQYQTTAMSLKEIHSIVNTFLTTLSGELFQIKLLEMVTNR